MAASETVPAMIANGPTQMICQMTWKIDRNSEDADRVDSSSAAIELEIAHWMIEKSLQSWNDAPVASHGHDSVPSSFLAPDATDEGHL